MLAKTLADEAAWNFAKANALDLVTINPAYVIGPLLQPTLNTTVEMILNLVNGSMMLHIYLKLVSWLRQSASQQDVP